MDLENLLKELSNKCGLGSLALNQEDVCKIVFDDKFEVNFEKAKDRQHFYLYTILGKVPAEGKEAFYLTLLEANLFGYGTHEASFGVNKETSDVLLYQIFDLNVTDFQYFYNELEIFLNTQETWTKRFETGDFGNLKSEDIPKPKLEDRNLGIGRV